MTTKGVHAQPIITGRWWGEGGFFGCRYGRTQARERERSGRSGDGQEREAFFGPK